MKSDDLKISEELRRSSLPILSLEPSGSIAWANEAALPFIGSLNLPCSAEVLLGDRNLVSAAGPQFLEIQSGPLAGMSGIAVKLGEYRGSGSSCLIFLYPRGKGITDFSRAVETLSSAAHDLKNPIGAICGYADALLDTPAGSGMNDKQLGILDKIRGAASRSIAMVRNYQFLGEMEKKFLPHALSSSDLNQAAARAVDHLTKEHKLTPRIELNLASGPLLARIEYPSLEKAIFGLIDNALLYTPPNGEITLSSNETADEVHLSVANSPTFIPDEDKALLFKRFGRGAAGRGKIGAGLGLYIAKHVIDAAGGSLDFESAEGRGTIFSIRLPRAKADEALPLGT